jgi:hypothetical protein
MKTVNDDPYEFFREGGWSFLAARDDVSFTLPIAAFVAKWRFLELTGPSFPP